MPDRLSADDEHEIRWLWFDAASHLGHGSAFGRHLDRAAAQLQPCSTWRNMIEETATRSIVIARRADRIRSRLLAMPIRLRQALLAAYCADRPPGMAGLDRLGAVVLLTDAARDAYRRSTGTESRPRASTLARWIAPKINGPAQNATLRADVLSQADALLSSAVRDWQTRKVYKNERCL